MKPAGFAHRIGKLAAALCMTFAATAALADPVSLNIVDVAGNLALTKADTSMAL